MPVVLISHNMPHVFEVADRIHIHRLGRRLCVIDPKDYTMSDAVAFMTGAKEPPRGGDRRLIRPPEKPGGRARDGAAVSSRAPLRAPTRATGPGRPGGRPRASCPLLTAIA